MTSQSTESDDFLRSPTMAAGAGCFALMVGWSMAFALGMAAWEAAWSDDAESDRYALAAIYTAAFVPAVALSLVSAINGGLRWLPVGLTAGLATAWPFLPVSRFHSPLGWCVIFVVACSLALPPWPRVRLVVRLFTLAALLAGVALLRHIEPVILVILCAAVPLPLLVSVEELAQRLSGPRPRPALDPPV